MKRGLVILIITLLLATSVFAATLKGSIYNTQFDLEGDVLVEINTQPPQKFLAKDGSYQLEIPTGIYTLTITKGLIETTENIKITKDGTFVYDIFLLEDFTDENAIWQETQEDLLAEDETSKYASWRYWLAGLIVLVLLYRFFIKRKKYGPLRKFKKAVKIEHNKTIQEHKQDIAKEPGYLDNTLSIIKKHDGRISQKQLRQELLHLSEAKVSLILTELEHKGKIEKVKKGRGNVILLKD